MDKISNKVNFFLLVVFLMIFVNYKFKGSLHHGFYYQIPQFFNSPEYFIHNFFIEKSSVIYSSIYYPTLKYLNIDIYNGLNSF